MTLDMLSAFREAAKEADAFEHHPISEQGLEEQILYLQGLAMVMNAEGDIDQREQSYLQILLKSFSLDSAILEDLTQFALAPDTDTIQSFLRCYRRKPLAQVFLFDALMMTRRDERVHEKEIALVNAMAEQLEILKGTQRDIFDLFCLIRNKNWIECSLYFDSYLLNSEHFQHLLDYHGVDLNDLLKQAKDIGNLRLRENLEFKLGLTRRAKEKPPVWTFLKSSPMFDLFAGDGLKNSVIERNMLVEGEWHLKNKVIFHCGGTSPFQSKTQAKLSVEMKIVKSYMGNRKTLRPEEKIASVILKGSLSAQGAVKSTKFTLVESKELNLSGGIDGLVDNTCLLSSDIMIPFLQNLVDRREVRIVGDDRIVKIKGKSKSKVKNEIELCQLRKLGLGYDKEHESLIVISNSKSSYSTTDMPLELLNELIERVK